jgi:hypothetical protein
MNYLKQLSWFGALKFCHSKGWLFGAMNGIAFENKVANDWGSDIGKSIELAANGPA